MTQGYPHPIPYYELGIETAQIGALGNTPLPVGLLEMPISAAAYLYFKAATFNRIVEFTPLAEGPGTRIDYTGATGWTGTKFITSETISMLDSLPQPVPFTEQKTDQAMRDEIRGYALTSAPISTHPGAWMGIRQADAFTEGTYNTLVQSEVAATMNYNLSAQDWGMAKTDFEAANALAIADWDARLQEWLQAEQAKVPPNLPLIADIERQQDVVDVLTPQIGDQATLVEEEIDEIRAALPSIGWTAEQIDALSRNLITIEQDAFARWIAGEEKLEAYAATRGPLWQLRVLFKRHVLFELQRQTIGWLRRPNPLTYSEPDLLKLGFVGAGISTESLAALTSTSIPALASAQVGMLTRNFLGETGTGPGDWKNVGTGLCATMFEVPYTLPPDPESPATAPISGIIHASIGPVLLGVSPEMCVSNLAKGFLPQLNPSFRLWDIESPEVYDAVWPTVESYWNQFNEISQSPAGTVVGKFRIETITGDALYECDLYANPSTVGAVNITLRTLTERV
jgi:hypothetical protein